MLRGFKRVFWGLPNGFLALLRDPLRVALTDISRMLEWVVEFRAQGISGLGLQ